MPQTYQSTHFPKPSPRPRPVESEHYQVVVIGGGPTGVCAGIAAARSGMSTVILQNRACLGGNGSGEIGVIVQGADEMGRFRHARETGLIDELYTRNVMLPNPTQSGSLWSLVLWEACTAQDNLTVYMNTIARDPVVEGDRIVSVRAEQFTTERDLQITGDMFIDCSGDGRIAYEAGADYMQGRESRDAYGEPLAEAVADGKTMGNTIYIRARDMGRPVPFKAPPWIHQITSDDQLPFQGKHAPHSIKHLIGPNGGWWWMEFGGENDTIKDSELIRDELTRYAIGMWDHLKNHGDHGAENYALESVGVMPGKRESRRFVGDHVYTQHDVEHKQRFEDVIAYTQWHVDVHNPAGVTSNASYWKGAILRNKADLPLRSFFSRNVGNLWFAGRNFSATHVGFASPRVMATCAIMGQAVGHAAALCVTHGCTPRDLHRQHLKELQQDLLRQDCYLPYVVNEDPDDLARSATARASSQTPLVFPEPEGYMPIEAETAQAFFVSADRINHITIPLDNRGDTPLEVTLHLRHGQWVDDFTDEQDIATATATVVPGRSDVRFCFDLAVEPGSQYWVMLEPHPALSWGFACAEPPCTNAAWKIDQIYGDPPYPMFKRERGTNCLTLDPPSSPFGPEQVLTGVARPERQPNVWISGPGLPQWLELTWPEPITFNEVHLTFDNNLDRKRSNWSKVAKAPELIRHYRVYVERNGALELVLEEKENYFRKRVHTIEAVTSHRLRVEACAAWGEPSTEPAPTQARPEDGFAGHGAAARDYVDFVCDEARMHEVRVYHRAARD